MQRKQLLKTGSGKTHREISIEVVFPVKKWLPVYGAVERQSCHHCCLHTSSVEDLGKHRDITKWPAKKGITKQQGICAWLETPSLTGNVPGKDASKNDTREFGGAEKQTEEPENSLVLEWIWAWISKPTTPTSCSGALRQRETRHETDITKSNQTSPIHVDLRKQNQPEM